jgi:hypothetical protein
MAGGPPRRRPGAPIDEQKLDAIVAAAQRAREERERGYRERALKLYPWVCGRCGRSFTHANLRELTVHHRDGNHDNNPLDGSNWELLCLYCHDNEHQKYEEHLAALAAGRAGGGPSGGSQVTNKDFEGLADLLKRKE